MIEKTIKWYSVKDDGLPKQSGKYLTQDRYGMDFLDYSAKYGCWNASDDSYTDEEVIQRKKLWEGVIYWAFPAVIKPMDKVVIPTDVLREIVQESDDAWEIDEFVNLLLDFAEGRDVKPDDCLVGCINRVIEENTKN